MRARCGGRTPSHSAISAVTQSQDRRADPTSCVNTSSRAGTYCLTKGSRGVRLPDARHMLPWPNWFVRRWRRRGCVVCSSRCAARERSATRSLLCLDAVRFLHPCVSYCTSS
jgi:hypothetical protein